MAESGNTTPDLVKLISREGHEFFVDRKAALVSGTIKSMLSSAVNFGGEPACEIRFPEINSVVLEKVCQYFHYKVKYSDSPTSPPEFTIEPEIALELLTAANFLDT
eukprot:gnl/Hemi2/22150_TR7382_c0_g1_i1.p2 gnl/Hemi2/22150_TR7382_c0_g1~~gnl/Hemi2/22150_TR7382_c0_g1_i1.p2  ORF type:complete len:106 (+),score=36.10 gnl/Hemi2/22150_TR7382_c0_g1_i1:177-494(+)